ncbi:MAG: hypothetical protein HY361_00680 [Candidatus Aenigmarchaeota archaeon]|nr:hypothetical protein [Candidatus Aenigmarchaeota archaeon]
MKQKIKVMIVVFLLATLIFLTIQIIEGKSVNPEDERMIGYEYLNSNGDIVEESQAEVVHIWNEMHDFYFNKTSGIQFTNNFDEYWTRNIFCGGYKQGNWIYTCNDELPFNWNIKTDNETYVNYTGYKDLTIGEKQARVAIRYALENYDGKLTIYLSVENIGETDINNDLGFAWKSKDIQISQTISEDKLFINDTSYALNDSLDITFTSLEKSTYYLYDDKTFEYIELNWDENLNYALQVKQEAEQFNSPVTLAINLGTLTQGEQKTTKLFWIDAPAPDPTWNTGNHDFSIWTTDTSLTWNSGTKVCEANLTDGNSQIVDCIMGGILPNINYRVQFVLKNNETAQGNISIDDEQLLWNLKVRDDIHWAGFNSTLGSCAFNDLGSDDGNTICEATFDDYCEPFSCSEAVLSDVKIQNNGTGLVIIRNGSTEGFMYNITTAPNAKSDNQTYLFFDGPFAIDKKSNRIRLQLVANESQARQAIEQGLFNVLSNYSNFTDKQIYIRTQNNLQQTSTFDKAVTQSNKTWAVNYISPNENYSNMFNITPVFYVLELTSMNTTEITQRVEEFITNTL